MARRWGAQITVVFDGANVAPVPTRLPLGAVDVVFTDPGRARCSSRRTRRSSSRAARPDAASASARVRAASNSSEAPASADRAAAASACALLVARASVAACTAGAPASPRAMPTLATSSRTRPSTTARNAGSVPRARLTRASTRGCLRRFGVQVWYWRSAPGRSLAFAARSAATAVSR